MAWVVVWVGFGKSYISMTKVIITYDVCHDGSLPKTSFHTQSLTPTRQDTRQIKREMSSMIEDAIDMPRNAEKNRDLIEMLKTLGETCRKCAPLTPLECISRCTLLKLKNELRA